MSRTYIPFRQPALQPALQQQPYIQSHQYIQQEQAVQYSSDVVCGCNNPAKKSVCQKENANKGREFLCCAEYPSKCGFFQWADQRQAPKKWAGAKRPAAEFRQHSAQFEQQKRQKAPQQAPNQIVPQLEDQDCIPDTPELSQLVPSVTPANSPAPSPWQEATMKLIAVQLEQNAKNTAHILERFDKTVDALNSLTEALHRKKEKKASSGRIPPP